MDSGSYTSVSTILLQFDLPRTPNLNPIHTIHYNSANYNHSKIIYNE